MNTLEFQYNASLVHFTTEAFVNLTEMCRVYGKRPIDFLRLPSSKRYIEALKRAFRVCDNLTPETTQNDVIFTQKGELAGTWAHPDFAMECARWLDPDFSVWCNQTIRRILTGEMALASYLPANIPPLILADRLALMQERLAIVQEMDAAHPGQLVATANRIAARNKGRKGLESGRTNMRSYYRWIHSGRNPISLVPYASIYKRAAHRGAALPAPKPEPLQLGGA